MIAKKYLIWETWTWKTELFKDINNSIIINFLEENTEEIIEKFKNVLNWNYKHIIFDETITNLNNEKQKIIKSFINIMKEDKKRYFLIIWIQSVLDIQEIEERLFK